MKCLSLIVTVLALALTGCTDGPNTSRNALAFNQNTGPGYGFNPNAAQSAQAIQAKIQKDLQTLQSTSQSLYNLGIRFETQLLCIEFDDSEDLTCKTIVTIPESLYDYRPMDSLEKQRVSQSRKLLETYANTALNSPLTQAPQMSGLPPVEIDRIHAEAMAAQEGAKFLQIRESMEKMFEKEKEGESVAKITHQVWASGKVYAKAQIRKPYVKKFKESSEQAQKDMSSAALSFGEYRNMARSYANALRGLNNTKELADIMEARAEIADEMVMFLQDRAHDNIAKMIALDKEILKIRAQTKLDSKDRVTFTESELQILSSLTSMYRQYEDLADETVFDDMSYYSEVPFELKSFYNTMVRKKDDAARQVAFIQYRIAESDTVLYLGLLEKLGVKFTRTDRGEFNWEGPDAGTLTAEKRNEIFSSIRKLREILRRMGNFGRKSGTYSHVFILSEMGDAGGLIAAATDAQNHYDGR